MYNFKDFFGCGSKNHINYDCGFTIVELLVVIVIIGILAAISIVSYSGISQKAIITSIQSDLSNSTTKFKIYQVENGSYPTSVDCSAVPAANSVCIKTSGGNSFVDIQAVNAGSRSSFCINIANGTNFYFATDGIGPTVGTCPVDSSKYITTGEYTSCALSVSNVIYCWGEGSDDGQLGNGLGVDSSTPVAVDASQANSSLYGKTVTAIAAGGEEVCALDSEGRVHCWGYAMGDGTTNTRLYPTAVDVGASSSLQNKTVVAIAVGENRGMYALDSDGYVHSWGQMNTSGWLGYGDTSTSLRPKLVDTGASSSLNGKKVVAISAGDRHACALDSEGHAHCWGYGANGRIGNGSTNNQNRPVAVDVSTSSLSGKIVTSISASYWNTCALDSEGHVHCWGYGSEGQVGDGLTTQRTIPVAVDIGSSSALNGKIATAIAVTHGASCAKVVNGTIYCWGSNTSGYGQLGETTLSPMLIPNIPVDSANGSSSLYGKTIRTFSGGSMGHFCAIDTLGQPHCWGSNGHGQIGNGTLVHQTSPYGVILP